MTFQETMLSFPGPAYSGLRMSADEFLALPDDGFRYELIDGVVVMSPSPSRPHQRIAFEIAGQLYMYLRDHPVGEGMHETDVQFPGDLVYRPDVIFVAAARLSPGAEFVTVPPDLVVEVVSPDSGPKDRKTKRMDYERAGVREYWLIDPGAQTLTFLRNVGGRFTEVAADGDVFRSEAVPGFVLDIAAIRRLMVTILG